jgi:HD-GYP domain-containing protein (c-di-GMP phosphodiesterase class II)
MIELKSVNELQIGMFVCELDRPWVGTPFLLEGLLLEEGDDIATLQKLCKYVKIDYSRSVGIIIPEEMQKSRDVSIKRAVNTDAVVHTVREVVVEKAAQDKNKKSASMLSAMGTIFSEAVNAGNPAPAKARARPGQPILPAEDPTANKVNIRSVTMPTDKAPAKADPDAVKALDKQAIRDKVAGPKLDRGLAAETAFNVHTVDKKEGLVKSLFGLFRKAEYEPDQPQEEQKQRAILRVYEEVTTVEQEIETARDVHDKAKTLIAEMMEELQKNRMPDVEKVKETVDGMVDSIVRNPDALLWLTKLKTKDSYTYGHSIDVSIYLASFGRHLGLPKDDLNMLGMAGMLQDIGKIRLPKEILEKNQRLTPQELEIVKSHVGESMKILTETPGVPKQVLNIVANHHERFDGTGYPRKLQGDAIGMYASMAAIVDTFEAMTSERPYSKAMTAQEALRTMHGWKDKTFEKTLVEQFIQCVGIYPVGSLVELNTGDIGIVIAQNRVRRLQPRIMLLMDGLKEKYKTPISLDLLTEPVAYGNTVYQIKKSLPPNSHGIDPREYYL